VRVRQLATHKEPIRIRPFGDGNDDTFDRQAAQQGMVEGTLGPGSLRHGGNAVATIAIAKWEGALDGERRKRVLDGEVLPVARV
jgi:hypothetical protein